MKSLASFSSASLFSNSFCQVLRKKSNAKCKSVFERLHQVKNYDWWLIYKFQNPGNFDDPYFSFEEFVEKEVLDTEQDKEVGSEEDPFEPSEETNSSSED